MWKMLDKKQTGFTIVELLIVIVVIGILAAITVVAYNGIQSRAYNTAVIAEARRAVSLVEQYTTVNSRYPITASELCLTTDNVCQSNVNIAVTSNNASLMNELRGFGEPARSAPAGNANGRTGIIYYNFTGGTYNGQSQPVYVYYVLKGTYTNCGLPNIANDARSALAVTASSTGYSWTSPAGMTGCYVHINGPNL